VSLRNAAARVGASRRSSYVSSKVLPVPPTDICLSRSVRSGNDGRLRVVPWGASMSLHSVSRVPIIYLCSRSHTPKWGLLVSLYKLGTCESRFTVTAP
jgi:hypothetical protein